MQYRNFGKTELRVSEIGFGAWAIGGGAVIGDTAIGWGQTDDSVSIKAIYAALDAGINFFDTADIYGLGHSEELLGKTIGKNREAIIASKAGNVSRNGSFSTDYSPAHIIRACEDSLRRLQREAIDYYQLHTVKLPDLEKGECTAAMEQLKKQGKIRYWGVSLNSFEPKTEWQFLVDNNLGDGFQLVLNIINQTALPLVRQAAAKQYGIIARMPLQFGLLTGKFDNKTVFAKNDHRSKRLTPEVLTAATKALPPVWELCDLYDCSKTQLALSYILQYPGISVVIPGIRTPQQVKENTLPTLTLHPTEIETFEEIGRNHLASLMELIRKQG
jgi:aryl-alcohol dehydrogenase-like predicted oxidoreductase